SNSFNTISILSVPIPVETTEILFPPRVPVWVRNSLFPFFEFNLVKIFGHFPPTVQITHGTHQRGDVPGEEVQVVDTAVRVQNEFRGAKEGHGLRVLGYGSSRY